MGEGCRRGRGGEGPAGETHKGEAAVRAAPGRRQQRAVVAAQLQGIPERAIAHPEPVAAPPAQRAARQQAGGEQERELHRGQPSLAAHGPAKSSEGSGVLLRATDSVAECPPWASTTAATSADTAHNNPATRKLLNAPPQSARLHSAVWSGNKCIAWAVRCAALRLIRRCSACGARVTRLPPPPTCLPPPPVLHLAGRPGGRFGRNGPRSAAPAPLSRPADGGGRGRPGGRRGLDEGRAGPRRGRQLCTGQLGHEQEARAKTTAAATAATSVSSSQSRRLPSGNTRCRTPAVGGERGGRGLDRQWVATKRAMTG